jgi:nitric oxide reductase subunit B
MKICDAAKHCRGCSDRNGHYASFVAVAFWNMVGEGLFGFMINPIALYYLQGLNMGGLNTTPLHGLAALCGVY